MKKFIKYLTIILITTIPTFLIVDGWIIKKIIINQIELQTQKKAYLNNVKISYFPIFKVELNGLMIPNPKQDNFLISSESISLKVNIEKLFHKSLIIEEILSKNTIIFDTSKKTIPIMKKNETSNSTYVEETSNKSLLKNKIKEIVNNISVNDYLNADIKEISYDKELSEIDEIIDSSNKIINEKKEIILTNTNSILYKINSLKVDNIDSINKYNELNKSLKKIKKDTDKVKKEIDSLDDIYIQSINKIDDIETNIIKNINNSLNISIKETDSNVYSTFTKPIEKIIKNILINTKKEEKSIKRPIFSGITYPFLGNNNPTFLIKVLEINKPENNLYFTGQNLTFSKSYKKPLSLSGRIKNQKEFRRFEIEINSKDKINYYINQETKNIVLNKEKIYSDENIRVDILENNTTYTEISGVISNEIDMNIELLLENPSFRVINKTPTPDIKQAFFEAFNDEDIQVSINITGTLSDLKIDTKTNLDNLISDISKKVIDEKIDSFQQNQDDKIAKIKKDNKKAVDKKIASFDNNYNESLKKMNFQLNEIMNQKKETENHISEKKKELESSVKDKFSEEADKLFN